MTWKLFLDDQIHDPETPRRWTPVGFLGAASSREAISLVEKFGPPELMSLDHDLGESDRAIDFLKWLADHCDDPPQYLIHSANPVGRENLRSFMESWIRSKR